MGKRKSRTSGGASSRKPRRPGGKRWRRLLYPAAFFLTVLTAAETYAGALVLREGRALLRDHFGGGEICGAAVDFFSMSVRLEGVSIPQQGYFRSLPPAFELPDCRLGLDWRIFLSPRVMRLRRIDLAAPRLRVLSAAAGGASAASLGEAFSGLGGTLTGRSFWAGRLTVADGEILFQTLAPDLTVRHTLAVRRLAAEVTDAGSRPDGDGRMPGSWRFAGVVGESAARLAAAGRLGPLAAPATFSIERLSCEGLPLVAAAPQIEAATGCRPIEGLLDLRLRAACERGRLSDASLEIRLRGASFEGLTSNGREIASYVRSRNGDLRETFSMRGTWESPEVVTSGFVTRLVWRKVGQGIAGILALPFRVLSAIAGGGGE